MSLRALRLVSWVLIAAILAGLGAYALLRDPAAKPTDSSAALEPITGIGGPFALLDQNRRIFTEKDLQGRATAIFFGYTYCPDVCPTTLLETTRWMSELGADADKLRVVFVTVDPERDTPEKLAEYIPSFDPRIVGLSGTREDVDRMLKAYRVYSRKVENKTGDYLMDHTAAVYLLDPAGRFVGVIDYQEATEKAMAKIRRLVAKS